MKYNAEETAIRILSEYLEDRQCRKTPERYAVLKTIYSFKSHFSVQEVVDRLLTDEFAVSRGTVYNALRLFMKLNLVVCHRLKCGIRYEARIGNNACRRICTVCGSETDIRVSGLDSLMNEAHIKRFRIDRYTLFIYGVCSSCQAMMTRRKRKINNNKN